MIAALILTSLIASADDKPATPPAKAPVAKAPVTKAGVQPSTPQKVMQMNGDKIDGHVMDFKGDTIQGGVMDFKGDVIGADRKPSPVFLEMGAGDPEVGSLIFKRADFNDFHDTEKSQRVHVMPIKDDKK